MKRVKLTQGKFAWVDNEDFANVVKYKWHILKSESGKLYACHSVHSRTNGKNSAGHLFLHQMIAKPKKGFLVDHINGNGLDNRRKNLRVCNKIENGCNKGPKRDNKSGYKGVSWNKRVEKWESQIMNNKVKIWLGYFVSKVQAAKAYDAAAREFHKEFAYTNFRK